MAAFMTPAARSHGLRDSAATVSRMLGRTRMIHTPCASTSSTISCNTCSSLAISNDGGSRRARVVGFGVFRVADDGDAADRKWMWMTGGPACRGNSYRVRGPVPPGSPGRFLRINGPGVFRKILMRRPPGEPAPRRRKRMCCALVV